MDASHAPQAPSMPTNNSSAFARPAGRNISANQHVTASNTSARGGFIGVPRQPRDVGRNMTTNLQNETQANPPTEMVYGQCAEYQSNGYDLLPMQRCQTISDNGQPLMEQGDKAMFLSQAAYPPAHMVPFVPANVQSQQSLALPSLGQPLAAQPVLQQPGHHDNSYHRSFQPNPTPTAATSNRQLQDELQARRELTQHLPLEDTSAQDGLCGYHLQLAAERRRQNSAQPGKVPKPEVPFSMIVFNEDILDGTALLALCGRCQKNAGLQLGVMVDDTCTWYVTVDNCRCASNIVSSTCRLCEVGRITAAKRLAFEKPTAFNNIPDVMACCACGGMVHKSEDKARKCAGCSGLVTAPYSNFKGQHVESKRGQPGHEMCQAQSGSPDWNAPAPLRDRIPSSLGSQDHCSGPERPSDVSGETFPQSSVSIGNKRKVNEFLTSTEEQDGCLKRRRDSHHLTEDDFAGYDTTPDAPESLFDTMGGTRATPSEQSHLMRVETAVGGSEHFTDAQVISAEPTAAEERPERLSSPLELPSVLMPYEASELEQSSVATDDEGAGLPEYPPAMHTQSAGSLTADESTELPLSDPELPSLCMSFGDDDYSPWRGLF